MDEGVKLVVVAVRIPDNNANSTPESEGRGINATFPPPMFMPTLLYCTFLLPFTTQAHPDFWEIGKEDQEDRKA